MSVKEEKIKTTKQYFKDNQITYGMSLEMDKWLKEKKYYSEKYKPKKKVVKSLPNPIRKRAIALAGNYRRTDEEKGRDTSNNITSEEIYEMLSAPNAECFYCGEGWFDNLGLDRIDSCKPHTKNNCVLCCPSCNSNKGTQNFYDYVRKRLKRKTASENLLKFIEFAETIPSLPLSLPPYIDVQK